MAENFAVTLLVVALLAAGVVGLLVYAKRSRFCYVCSVPMVRWGKLPERERASVRGLLRGESPRMTETEIEGVYVCRRCRRAFDGRWFTGRRSGESEMEDATVPCVCGGGLMKYLCLWTPPLLSDEAKGGVRERLRRRGISGGCVDRPCTDGKRTSSYYFVCDREGQVFFCAACGRAARWERLGRSEYRVFRMVSGEG